MRPTDMLDLLGILCTGAGVGAGTGIALADGAPSVAVALVVFGVWCLLASLLLVRLGGDQ